MVERIKRKKSSYLPLLENTSPTASPGKGQGENAAGDQKKTEREETIESIINAFSLPHRNEFYMSRLIESSLAAECHPETSSFLTQWSMFLSGIRLLTG